MILILNRWNKTNKHNLGERKKYLKIFFINIGVKLLSDTNAFLINNEEQTIFLLLFFFYSEIVYHVIVLWVKQKLPVSIAKQ